ncbi:MAG TPA: 4a-hydroxytetrahydrobiopterin dehydratase [Longimicrobiales bacterium]|nr:4a-hydroxytetrahydrobiopterin dehydratase [Longimicrobiales bacterium]
MLLNDTSVSDWTDAHPGWSRSGDVIQKTYDFDSFRDSVVFVNRVATLADEADHHPDIDIRYDKVRIGLATHSEGGITEKDTALAEQIDRATSNR